MAKQPGRIDTILGKNSVIHGDVSLIDHSRVEGEIIGKLRSSGDVVVADSASINGDVIAESVFVFGTVVGNVFAKFATRVYHSGRVEGEIHAKEIAVEGGGIFDGKCQMIDEDGKFR